MGKIFCAEPASNATVEVVAPLIGGGPFNLYDLHMGVGQEAEGPRDALPQEVRAYLEWLARSRGLWVPSNAIYTEAGILHPDRTSYIVDMPGYGASGIVTCELLDDAGEVVRTMTLPTVHKGRGAGSLPMTPKQVKEWTGIVPTRKPRAKKAAPIAAAVAAPEPVQQQEATPAHSSPSPDVSALVAAVERLTARVAALETAATGGKRVRSDSERRAIVRAWEMRRNMRERADLDRLALLEANETNRLLRAKVAALAIEVQEQRGAFERINGGRRRTAARMVRARAAARTEARRRIGAETGLRIAEAELARLAPVAAAIAAMTPIAPAGPASLRLVEAA